MATYIHPWMSRDMTRRELVSLTVNEIERPGARFSVARPQCASATVTRRLLPTAKLPPRSSGTAFHCRARRIRSRYRCRSRHAALRTWAGLERQAFQTTTRGASVPGARVALDIASCETPSPGKCPFTSNPIRPCRDRGTQARDGVSGISISRPDRLHLHWVCCCILFTLLLAFASLLQPKTGIPPNKAFHTCH